MINHLPSFELLLGFLLYKVLKLNFLFSQKNIFFIQMQWNQSVWGMKFLQLNCYFSITVSYSESYFFESKFCVYSFDSLYCITLVCLCVCVGRSVMSDLCDPTDWSPPGSSVHASSLVKKTGMGCRALSRGSSQPRDRTWSPALQADSLPSEPQGITLMIYRFH